MARLPVLCSSCDFIGFVPSGRLGASLALYEAEETCPRCGGLAEVVPATYNLGPDVTEIVKAPAGSILWLQKIARVRTGRQRDEPSRYDAAPMVRFPGATSAKPE